MWLYVNAKIAYSYTFICGKQNKQTYVHMYRTINLSTNNPNNIWHEKIKKPQSFILFIKYQQPIRNLSIQKQFFAAIYQQN